MKKRNKKGEEEELKIVIEKKEMGRENESRGNGMERSSY